METWEISTTNSEGVLHESKADDVRRVDRRDRAIATSVSVADASGTAGAKNVACKLKTIQQTGKATGRATALGLVVCGKPFGVGLEASISTGTVSGNVFTNDGLFKLYFDRGTVHGKFKLAGSTQTGLSSGTLTFTGGTAAFKHARGSGTIACKTAANSPLSVCKVKSTFTGI